MKKRKVNVFLSVVVAAATIVSLSACGNSSGAKGVSSDEAGSSKAIVSSEAVASESVSSASEPVLSEAKTSGTEYSSIDEFVKSSEIQDQLPSLKASVEKMGMDMEITGDKNKLIYSYQFKNDVKTSAETLDSALEAQKATFQGIAASLKQAVKVENPVVVVRYMDQSGKEITSREFTAQ